MVIDFYYWGSMCPLNQEMLCLLQEYADQIDIRTHDISFQTSLADKLGMFYPTLTVVNHQYRFFSPLRRDFLDKVSRCEVPQEKTYQPILGRKPYTGTILPITEENYYIAGNCVGHSGCKGCRHKVESLKQMGLSVFGFMNVQDGRLLGGAEYIPSTQCPYTIPHDKKKAFITCVYLSDNTYDYKSAPLSALEEYLVGQYESVLVVSDEKGDFPNGDLEFFRQHGYLDLGVIAQEKEYCVLHLLEKYL